MIACSVGRKRPRIWQRRIGVPVFPAWETADGFQVCTHWEDWVHMRRARYLVNLLDKRGNRTASKFLRPEGADSAWADWWRHRSEIWAVEVYDRATRTHSRFQLPNPGQWIKACFLVGPDDNGAVCVRSHIAWDPR